MTILSKKTTIMPRDGSSSSHCTYVRDTFRSNKGLPSNITTTYQFEKLHWDCRPGAFFHVFFVSLSELSPCPVSVRISTATKALVDMGLFYTFSISNATISLKLPPKKFPAVQTGKFFILQYDLLCTIGETENKYSCLSPFLP